MASPSVTCYPQPGKAKARRLCEAFAAGVRAAGGSADVCIEIPAALRPGAAVFYGVRPAWAHLWHQARAEGRDWWYLDNAYFDRARERYFRVTRNALQVDALNAAWHAAHGPRWRERLDALGVAVRPWRTEGYEAPVVVCPQSREFMDTVAGWAGRDWLGEAVAALKAATRRPMRIRAKGDPRPLAKDLRGAWALVTHVSCAAVEALAAGVPVFCTGRCAARVLDSGALEAIETPRYPDRREEILALLADNQWTMDEIAAGDAWRAWNR